MTVYLYDRPYLYILILPDRAEPPVMAFPHFYHCPQLGLDSHC